MVRQDRPYFLSDSRGHIPRETSSHRSLTMPSNRRIRLLFYVVLAGVVMTMFFTNHLRQKTEFDNRSIQDFYHKTKSAMDRARGQGPGQAVLDSKTGKEAGRTPHDKDADGDVDSDDEMLAKQMGERLKAAEQKAKELANAKAPNKPDRPDKVIGVGSSAGGQVKKATDDDEETAGKSEETDEEHEVEAELNRIFKQSPVTIFSKTYCPYSKRAKGILLEKYHIDPAPYVSSSTNIRWEHNFRPE